MPTARELLNADALRREAQSRMPKGVRVDIFAIVPNKWTGRTETYLKVTPIKEDTDEDPPAEQLRDACRR